MGKSRRSDVDVDDAKGPKEPRTLVMVKREVKLGIAGAADAIRSGGNPSSRKLRGAIGGLMASRLGYFGNWVPSQATERVYEDAAGPLFKNDRNASKRNMSILRCPVAGPIYNAF